MATNSSKYKLTGVNGSEIQISLNGPTGPTGPANVLDIGSVTTAETGVPAAASITGSSPSQLLHLTLPKGNTGVTGNDALWNFRGDFDDTVESIRITGALTRPNGDPITFPDLAYDGELNGKPSYRSGNAVCYRQAEANPDAWVIYYDDTNQSYAAWYSFENADSPELVTNWNPATEEGGTPVVTLLTEVFEVGDVVTYEGETWYCYNPYTFNPSSPQNPEIGSAYWQLIAAKGATGNTGATGTAATIAVGTTSTGEAGSSASVTNVGTNSAAVFDFAIPRGDTGATGPATQLSVASTSTGSAGSEASVTISGTAPVQSLAFTIPRGNTGATGPATQLSVASTATGAAGTDASVTISGTAPNQSLAFTIPQGIQGIQGETGSSGATALLTGYVSGAGTVAATDTVIQAVGKLNGNDELKAPIASLYPYIGGKLLTYLDEEAAIADPLISAGDIYRKTAGGVDYVNPDNVPSLDLRFATDKTLTARRGPTPTFSRASSGTFVNANGLIVGKTAGTTSSITPSTQAIGSQVTVTVASGSVVGWVVGQAISLIVDTDGQDDPDATELWLLGNIVSTTDTTLVFSVTSRTAQAGSATSWTLGYRGPRFDHDPVTLACKGLLIEEGRTNLFQYSEIFNEAASSNYWDSATANAVTSNQTTSPDGAATADLLTTSTTSFDCFVRRTINWVGSTQYSYSIFLKRGPSNHRYVGLYIGAGITGALQYPYFDFDNPTTVQIPSGTMVGTINSTRVDAYPNGWYRVSITFTTAATPVTIYGGVYVSTSNGTLSSTPTAGLDCYIWGIQAETGSFATSYIPTTTGTLARSADVCNITGGNFSGLYNQSEGTLLLSADEFRRGTSFPPLLAISNSAGFSANRISIVSYGAKTGNAVPLELLVTSGGTVQYSAIQTSTPSNFKAALAYKLDDARAALNGALAAADAPPSVSPIGADTLRIGGDGIYISSVRYYRKRLSNAKLQALTV